MVAQLLDREAAFQFMSNWHDQAHCAHGLLAGTMDQQAVYRMGIEFIPFQAIRMVGGILKRIFNAINLIANTEGFLQFIPRNRCGYPEIEMESIEERFFGIFRYCGREVCRGHN